MGVDQPIALGVRAFFKHVLSLRCTNAYFVKKYMEFCLYGSFYSTVWWHYTEDIIFVKVLHLFTL